LLLLNKQIMRAFIEKISLSSTLDKNVKKSKRENKSVKRSNQEHKSFKMKSSKSKYNFLN